MSELEERQWFYHPDGRSRIFEAGEAHPGKDWCETAADANLVPVTHPDRDTVLVPADKAKLNEGPVEIPEDWASLHHLKQMALAKRLGGAHGSKDEAMATIEAAVLARA